MKKISIVYFFYFFLFIAFLFTPGKQTYGQNPIPSTNVIVQGQALFVEGARDSGAVKGKRRINLSSKCYEQKAATESTCEATVYVASTDQQTILGPYTLLSGVTLSVEIDEREWGALVSTDDSITVSVWIDEIAEADYDADLLLKKHMYLNPSSDQYISRSGIRIPDKNIIYKTAKPVANESVCLLSCLPQLRIIKRTSFASTLWLFGTKANDCASDYISSKPSYTNKL